MKTKDIAIILAAAVGILLNTSVRAAENSALMEPVKSVLDHYLKIQSELAKDSIKGVEEHASAIAKAVPMPGGTFVLSLSNGQELQSSRFHSRLLRERLLRL